MGRNIGILLTLTAASVCAHAQGLHSLTRGTGKTPDGKPAPTARAPRRQDGHPDLSGVWQSESATSEELSRLLPGGANGLGEDPPSKYFLNILSDFRPEDVPLLPPAAASFRERSGSFSQQAPLSHWPAGVPMAETAPAPYRIIQTPGLIVMLYERDTNFRQIYTDGRKLPEDPSPAWFGHSIARWDADTLVVDTAGFNDRSWLDAAATRTATPCGSPSAFTAATSDTWMSKSLWTIPRPTRGHSPSGSTSSCRPKRT